MVTMAKTSARPVIRYGRRLTDRICDRIAKGETLAQVSCDADMPARGTLYRWRDKYPEFALQLAQAREAAADAQAAEALRIAKDSTAATVQADRLRVAALQWQAARMAPHRYGGKAEAQGPEPRRIVVEVRDFAPVTRPDGSVFAREILPDGSFVDGDD
jgi:hypothetical protein